MNTEINARPYGVAPPDFTLPEATTLGPVHLQVSDLARSLEYYQRIIGLHAEDVVRAARSARDAGYAVDDTGDGVRLADPWGTTVHLRTSHNQGRMHA